MKIGQTRLLGHSVALKSSVHLPDEVLGGLGVPITR